MFIAIITGFFSGLSLIAAIGAQNAFVLRQGIRREHVLAVVLACALSDAMLISAGAVGFGAAVEAAPWIAVAARWGGAAFLAVYGARSLISAWKGGGSLEPASDGTVTDLWPILAACLAVTWLNPHVYLDTVVLLGAIAETYGEYRMVFAAGAIAASFVFFFTIGFGARLLRPVFASPMAWRALDCGIGVFMGVLALSLVLAH